MPAAHLQTFTDLDALARHLREQEKKKETTV